MESYLSIMRNVLQKGRVKESRPGKKTLSLTGSMFEHDMSTGFPLLTTKYMAKKSMLVELEGFIKGVTSKGWYKERGCNIWNEWCNPQKVSYSHNEETKEKMLKENDLGPIYGFQWRHFGAEYRNEHSDYSNEGVDSLKNIVDTLKHNPFDRRMIVSAWNPLDRDKMALPPCHYGFQVLSDGKQLDLLWSQRSVDVPLGLPFNIASYGTLLHLLAKESGQKEGNLVGFLGDVHIYEDQIDVAKEQLSRIPLKLPSIKTENFSSIFNWNHGDTTFENYVHHHKLNYPLSI